MRSVAAPNWQAQSTKGTRARSMQSFDVVMARQLDPYQRTTSSGKAPEAVVLAGGGAA